VTIKDLMRPMPGVRQASVYRQRLFFKGSAEFWERNYARGDTSGPGSYGSLAEGKASFLNDFVASNGIHSVIEFGCGDGNQLSLARYPEYVGLDVSRNALSMCAHRFAGDGGKSFFLYDGRCFRDKAGIFTADLALSLDVIYHLVEDDVFELYMKHLFSAGRQYIVAYTTDFAGTGTAPHVRHRKVSGWVEQHCVGWRLVNTVPGPNDGPGRADFFVYERLHAGG
jgi:cyclopropane fatty-acyl-phospholipid synthase-like methyltransferase